MMPPLSFAATPVAFPAPPAQTAEQQKPSTGDQIESLPKLAEPVPTAPFYAQYPVRQTPVIGVGRVPDRFYIFGGRGNIVHGSVDAKLAAALAAKVGAVPVLTADGKATASLWLLTYDKTNYRNKDKSAIGYNELIVSIAATSPHAPHTNAANAADASKLATQNVVLKLHLDHPVPIDAGRIGLGFDKRAATFDVRPNGMAIQQADGAQVISLSVAPSHLPPTMSEQRLPMLSDDVLKPGQTIGCIGHLQTKKVSRAWGAGDTLVINPASVIGAELAALNFRPEAVESISDLRAVMTEDAKKPLRWRSMLARVPTVVKGYVREWRGTDLTGD